MIKSTHTHTHKLALKLVEIGQDEGEGWRRSSLMLVSPASWPLARNSKVLRSLNRYERRVSLAIGRSLARPATSFVNSLTGLIASLQAGRR